MSAVPVNPIEGTPAPANPPRNATTEGRDLNSADRPASETQAAPTQAATPVANSLPAVAPNPNASVRVDLTAAGSECCQFRRSSPAEEWPIGCSGQKARSGPHNRLHRRVPAAHHAACHLRQLGLRQFALIRNRRVGITDASDGPDDEG